MTGDAQFTDRMLVQLARDARQNAYAPFSNYTVGAACLGEKGTAYFGSNVENSSYPVGICAERVAASSAVSHGEKGLLAVAIAGGPRESPPDPAIRPCGMCLQFLAEFMKPDSIILIADGNDRFIKFTLAELLPAAFTLPAKNAPAGGQKGHDENSFQT